MKGKFFLLSLLALNIFCGHAQPAKLALQECIETALKNNISVRQSELQMKSAAINYRQAKNNRLPVIQSSYFYSINNGRSIDPFTNGYLNQQLKSSSVDVQGSIPLFNGFQLKNTIKQNELAFAGATMEWQQRKDELTLQVILAYLQVLSNEDAIALAKQQAAVTKQQVERIAMISNEGATALSNVSDLKGQYAGDQLALVNAENNFQSSALALAQLMNIGYNEKLMIEREGLADTVKQFDALPDEIYAMAIQKLAAVKATELRINSSTYAVKSAAAAGLPGISLFGGASTNYSSAALLNTLTGTSDAANGDYVPLNGSNLPVFSKQNNYSSKPIGYGSQLNNNISTGLGVNVRIPIFNSFRTRAAVKLAKNEELNNRLIADNIKLQLRQAIDQAYINITATYKRFLALQDQSAAYSESFRIASVRFENGVINAPEYLIAKNNLERTNANIIITRYEYLLRKKVIDFYMGRLN